MGNSVNIRNNGDAKKLHRSEKGGVGFYKRQFVKAGGTSNCVPIALAILHGPDYYDEINKLLLDNGFRISETQGTWTERFTPTKYGKGFRLVYNVWSNPMHRITAAGFAALNPKGSYMIQLKSHVVALIDGTVFEVKGRKMGGGRVYRVWKLEDSSVLIKYANQQSI